MFTLTDLLILLSKSDGLTARELSGESGWEYELVISSLLYLLMDDSVFCDEIITDMGIRKPKQYTYTWTYNPDHKQYNLDVIR